MSRSIVIKMIADLEIDVSKLMSDPDYPDLEKIMRRKVKEFSQDPGSLITEPRSIVSITGKAFDNPRFFESD